MLNVHDEPSLQKESTLLSPNTTLDGDEASIQKKAPLVKLDGTPERNESSYLKKAPPTKLHEKHAKEKPGRTTAYRATLKDDKRSHQKAALPKTKGTLTKGILLFKCLAAFCVPDSVGAMVAASAPSSPPPPMLCDNFSKVKKVGIIGAGVAGLQAANELRKAGLEVKVFEKSVGVAGVWRANYADFGLQVPRELYEFPGYAYPDAEMKEISGKGFDKFPPGHEVAEYIRMFADDMKLQQLISFETSVTRLEPIAGRDGWAMHHGKQGEPEVVEQFDFVVVATGMYSSDHVHLPEAEGMDRFQGQIMHSCQFKDASVCQGKSVVVVGGGKSSIDCVVAAANKGAKAAAMVFRTAHWPVPRKLLNLVPFQWGTFSRFGHFMLTTHYDVSPLWKYVHGVLSPLKWLWWRIVETMFRVQFGLKGDLLPESRIEIDIFGGGQILNYNFRDMLKNSAVNAIKGSISSFDEHGVTLEDGTRLDADIVVYGTGFGKSYEYLDRLLQNRLNIDRDGLFLYRNILPTGLPNIAFVGGEVSTCNNILTQGLQAVWLKRLLCGEFSLPPCAKMERAVEIDQAWKRTWMPFTCARAALFQLHMPKYHDQLVKDMGEPHLRKGRNKLAEIFQPYCAADYKDLFA